MIIVEEARSCIWEELLVRHKGGRNFHSRDLNGPSIEEYGFTIEQMEMIIEDPEYVRNKYSSNDRADNPIALDLLEDVDTYIA